MIAALVIAFREGLEAALIVGIIFGYLKKTGQTERNRYAWIGVLGAVLASFVLALGIQAIGAELEGRAEEIFEGTTMVLAVGILTWMIFWMRYQARHLKTNLEHELAEAVDNRQNWGLGLAAFLAVFREGVETALFLSAATFASDAVSTITGTVLGLGLAVGLGYAIYASAVRLNLGRFFSVTSLLLLVFAAGLLAHAVHEFQEAGILAFFESELWNTSAILDSESTLGEILGTVIGYTPNPSILQAIGYVAYWVFALLGVRWWVERKHVQHGIGQT